MQLSRNVLRGIILAKELVEQHQLVQGDKLSDIQDASQWARKELALRASAETTQTDESAIPPQSNEEAWKEISRLIATKIFVDP